MTPDEERQFRAYLEAERRKPWWSKAWEWQKQQAAGHDLLIIGASSIVFLGVLVLLAMCVVMR